MFKLYAGAVRGGGIDLTRMECKGNYDSRCEMMKLSIDLTRMECKGRKI